MKTVVVDSGVVVGVVVVVIDANVGAAVVGLIKLSLIKYGTPPALIFILLPPLALLIPLLYILFLLEDI